jgi:hypothetical protein
MTQKLKSVRKLIVDPDSIADSIERRRAKSYDTGRNTELLNRCETEWENLRKFRERSERCKRYTYGDQWGDYVVTHSGRLMREREAMSRKGISPLTNNLIRRLVNTVVGTYTKAQTEPICTARDRDEQKVSDMMTVTLQCNWNVNKMPVLLANQFEQFLISGAVFLKEKWKLENGKEDAYTEAVNPNNIFFTSEMKDPIHWDLSMIGELHDITFNELCAAFAKKAEDYDRLKELYAPAFASNNRSSSYDKTADLHRSRNMSFLTPYDPSMCRVIEVWTQEIRQRYYCWDILRGETWKIEEKDKEQIDAINAERIRQGLSEGMKEEDIPLIKCRFIMDKYWWYQFLTPTGVILEEGETPFDNETHPYTIKMYPFVNGEVHSFVADVIDQQRYFNRMITLNDSVIRSSSKGVLLVNQESIPDGMTNEEFAEQWTSVDGIVIYTAKPGVEIPQQIAQNSVNIGITEMMQLQMTLMNDISGVSGALQGKQPYSGTSAALYAQQTANNTASLSNLFQAYSSFVEDVATKKVQFIQQFYDDKRIVNIAGGNYKGIHRYEPNKARDIVFDLSIQESAMSPAARMLQNDMLMQMWQAGAISVEMMLEAGSFPFADNLLSMINRQKEEQAQAQAQQIPLEIMQQAQQGANQQNVQKAQQMLMQQ